ncbi:MAG: undecaprenyl/decaprenyl-phosphate alpha-N-acetylglucosaminyl 1-phosphate transferase [Oscillospiraceae bacterium]|nr:undecaprenyl/decaprenyl-phosphate alpha-N-acetylglucosaminyl 1-phosphate transferase [Oscillospiraceae bacterium]
MFDNNGLRIILSLLVAFLVSFSATPVVMLYANKIGAMDVPKDNRRVHKKPIPRIGGLAIFYGFIISVLIFAAIDREMMGILIGSVIIVTVGVIDDIKGLPAIVKLIFQLIAAGVVVYSGVQIEFLGIPNFISEYGGVIPLTGWISTGVTVLWIVAATNAVNLIDGLDGLAVGVSSIASMSLLALTLFVVGEPNIPIITAAVAGAGFGFLPYNYNPAKIFMGDTGSTFLGFILACVAVQGLFKMSAVMSLAIPILILGLPLFDTGFAFLRRMLKGQSPMTPDRGHLHHRLLDMGFTQRQAVAILYTMAAVLSLSAVVISTRGFSRGLLLVLAVAVIMMLGMKIRMQKAAPRLARRKEREEAEKEQE